VIRTHKSHEAGAPTANRSLQRRVAPRVRPRSASAWNTSQPQNASPVRAEAHEWNGQDELLVRSKKKKMDRLLAGERLCSPVLPRALLPCPEQLAFDQTAAILFFI
jgi:hypothetical protein